MRERKLELDALELQVAVVTFSTPLMAQAYVEDADWPWPVLLDPERSLYGAFEMDRAPARDIWSLATLKAYLRVLRTGEHLRPSDEDVYQRGGNVLVDPAGAVRLHHVGRGPADRPPVDQLLAVVRGSAQ